MKNILVVFIGSFNPPLSLHFSLAEQIVNEFKQVEKVVFVPTNKLYNKPGLIENIHRYSMLKLVIDKNPNFMLSSMELDNGRQLYTMETLKLIKEKYPDKEIWFTIGTDNLRQLSMWKNPEELVKNYKCIVLEKEEDNMEDIILNDEFLNKNKDTFIKLDNIIKKNVSSTFVRDSIKSGKSIRYLVPDEVNEYIDKNKLYK